jgi:hypothetical protein
MFFFPAAQVGDADFIIRIAGAPRRNVDHHRLSNQLAQRKLVNGFAALVEVKRRIDVRAAMLGRGKAICRIEVTPCRLTRRPLLKLKARLRGPINGLLIERMRQVDELGMVEPAVDVGLRHINFSSMTRNPEKGNPEKGITRKRG